MLSKLFNAVSGVLEFSKTKSKARSLLRGHSQALEELDTLRDTQRQAVTAVLAAHSKALLKARLTALKAIGGPSMGSGRTFRGAHLITAKDANLGAPDFGCGLTPLAEKKYLGVARAAGSESLPYPWQ